MKIPMDDIQATVETESGLNELVHSIITALNIRARVRDDDSLFQRGQQLAREMNAGVLHIAYDGFTSTEEAMELIKNQEAQAAAESWTQLPVNDGSSTIELIAEQQQLEDAVLG